MGALRFTFLTDIGHEADDWNAVSWRTWARDEEGGGLPS